MTIHPRTPAPLITARPGVPCGRKFQSDPRPVGAFLRFRFAPALSSTAVPSRALLFVAIARPRGDDSLAVTILPGVRVTAISVLAGSGRANFVAVVRRTNGASFCSWQRRTGLRGRTAPAGVRRTLATRPAVARGGSESAPNRPAGRDVSRPYLVWLTPHAAKILDSKFNCGGRGGADLAPGERLHEMDRSMSGRKHSSSAACDNDSTDGPDVSQCLAVWRRTRAQARR
jgi:hypothetical protein